MYFTAQVVSEQWLHRSVQQLLTGRMTSDIVALTHINEMMRGRSDIVLNEIGVRL